MSEREERYLIGEQVATTIRGEEEDTHRGADGCYYK
jgi:hypothetical protein